jgi:1-phosphatidylinositol-4-phosphate 5-kinase
VIAPHTYTFGIIDYFQQWTFQKRIERFWKVHLLRNDARGVSCVEPGWYHDRFLKSIRDILDIKQNEEDEPEP